MLCQPLTPLPSVGRLGHANSPIEQGDRGKAALTALFEHARNGDTPVMVESLLSRDGKKARYFRALVNCSSTGDDSLSILSIEQRSDD